MPEPRYVYFSNHSVEDRLPPLPIGQETPVRTYCPLLLLARIHLGLTAVLYEDRGGMGGCLSCESGCLSKYFCGRGCESGCLSKDLCARGCLSCESGCLSKDFCGRGFLSCESGCLSKDFCGRGFLSCERDCLRTSVSGAFGLSAVCVRDPVPGAG